MATENKKIKFSQLVLITSFTGAEIVPMAYLEKNSAATLEALKTYMADSALQFFARIITTAVPVGGLMPDLTEGEIAIVYLSYYRTFALEKTVRGASSYYLTFTSKDNYMEGTEGTQTPRTDRVFFNTDDKHLYIYNGSALVDLFDSVRIHVLTEEELENLQNPIEGAIYATLE